MSKRPGQLEIFDQVMLPPRLKLDGMVLQFNPPQSVDDLLNTYLKAGLPETVSDLRTMAALL